MPLSDDRLLDTVYERSARITRRRRIARGAGLVGLMALIVLVAVPGSGGTGEGLDTVDRPPATATTSPASHGAEVDAGASGGSTGRIHSEVTVPGHRLPEPHHTLPGGGRPPAADPGRIAFIDYDADRTSGTLATIDADGTDARTLAEVEPSTQLDMVRWAPDGTRVAYLDADYLTVINQDGSGRNRLTAAGSPVVSFDWSPDGQHLVYAIARPKGAAVHYTRASISTDGDLGIISADGLVQRPLTADTSSDWSPRWAPDGHTIYFNRYGYRFEARAGDGVFSIGSDGLGARLIRHGDYYPALAPSHDGRLIAVAGFDSESGFAETFHTDGSNASRIVPRFRGWYDSTLRWSPDDTHLALVDEYGGLHVAARDGSRQRTLGTTLRAAVAWLPGGRSLAVCSSDSVARVAVDGASTVTPIAPTRSCAAVDVAGT